MTDRNWNRSEMIHLLRDGQGKLSLTQYANHLGVSKQFLSNVLNGYDPPSDNLLRKLGYEREDRYVRIKKENTMTAATATKIGCAHCPAEFDTDEQLMDHVSKDHADKLRRPAKGTKQSTLVSVILDKSGSMSSKVQDVIGGFNTYVDELKKEQSVDYRFTLTLFDTDFAEKYLNEPLSAIKPLDNVSYQPGGSTALNDAIGRTIRLISDDKPEGKVIVVIMTDGEENSSHEYTTEAVKALIQQKEKEGWAFVFLGASPDAWQQGAAYGVPVSNQVKYDASDYRGTFAVMANATSATATGASPTHAMFSSTPDSMLRSCNMHVNSPDPTAGSHSAGLPVVTVNPSTPKIPGKGSQAWNKGHRKGWNKR